MLASTSNGTQRPLCCTSFARTLPKMGASSITTVASAERTSWLESAPISFTRGSSCNRAEQQKPMGRCADDSLVLPGANVYCTTTAPGS